MVIAMTDLGYLLWTRVTTCSVSHQEVAAIPGIVVPDPPIPIDVFRRVTGPSCACRYDLGEYGELELSTANVEAPSDKMLARHIVGTLSRRGVAQMTRKVGDAVFYKPPRGKNTKARLRVQVTAPFEEWGEAVDQFGESLRSKYAAGVAGTLDAQAVRRIIRTYLTQVGVLYIGGPYFLALEERVDPLRPLFDLLGEAGTMFVVPMPDTEQTRAVLARSLEQAIKEGAPVNDLIRNRLKEITQT